MPGNLLNLSPGDWIAWQELSGRDDVWACSPALLTEVVPLKTGHGLLRIRFIKAVAPIRSVDLAVELRIVVHAVDHLVATFKDEVGVLRTAAVRLASIEWMENRCAQLWPWFKRRTGWTETPAEVFGQVFGRSASEVLAGTTADSFGCEKPPMPGRTLSVRIDTEYGPFESFLIAKGFRPLEMEDKWFIYLAQGHLYVRRSWTGNLIYRVSTAWRGQSLYLDQAIVNIDPSQTSASTPDYHRQMVLYLVDGFLLDQLVDMPID